MEKKERAFEKIVDYVLKEYFTPCERKAIEKFFSSKKNGLLLLTSMPCAKNRKRSLLILFGFYKLLSHELEKEIKSEILLTFLTKTNKTFFYKNIFVRFLYNERNKNLTDRDIEDLIVLGLYRKNKFDVRSKIEEVKNKMGIDVSYNFVLWLNNNIQEQDEFVVTKENGRINYTLRSIPKAIANTDIVDIALGKTTANSIYIPSI